MLRSLTSGFNQISGRFPMPRAAAGVLVFALALSAATGAQARYASIVIDYDTGRVLHESNADTRNYPASMVKMMTLDLAFEALERGDITLDKKLTVSRRAAGMPAAKLGLKRARRSPSRTRSWR